MRKSSRTKFSGYPHSPPRTTIRMVLDPFFLHDRHEFRSGTRLKDLAGLEGVELPPKGIGEHSEEKGWERGSMGECNLRWFRAHVGRYG